MPDTPDAAPEPANGANPAEQPIHIHTLAAGGNGVAQAPVAAPEDAEASSARWSLSNISWQRLAIALLVLVAGAVASVLGARAVARSNADSAAPPSSSLDRHRRAMKPRSRPGRVLDASGTYCKRNSSGGCW